MLAVNAAIGQESCAREIGEMRVDSPLFSLRLFGPPGVHAADGGPVPLGRRARGLLTYLALARDRRASRERLAGLFWGDRGDAQARASLRQCLLEIRNALDTDPFVADREQVALAAHALPSELDRLTSARDDGPETIAALLREIGDEPFIADLELGEEFDEWRAGCRPHVERRVCDAATAAAVDAESRGDWAGVAAIADAWALRDPLDEAMTARGIIADLSRGDRATAERRRRNYAAALEREDGGVPGPAIDAALTTAVPLPPAPLLRAVPTAPRPTETNLPAPSGPAQLPSAVTAQSVVAPQLRLLDDASSKDAPVSLVRSRPARRAFATALLGAGIAAAAVFGWREFGTQSAPPNSVAVLPFDNLSGDPSQTYLSDGIAEELRGQLAGISGLQVAARTSSNAFRGSTEGAGAIARKLGVAYIVDGSVRRSNAVIRISAQLVEGKTGYERWSQSYDRKMDDLFAAQTEIAKTVTGALSVKLLPREAARLASGGTKSAAAHEGYLKGQQLYNLSGDESVDRAALAQFDAAIAADPDYAAAHAGRARTLAAIAGQFDTPAQARSDGDAALASARRAAALEPGLADAQSALGYVLERVPFDLPGARAAYEKSVAAGGGDADILIRYGLFNTRVGDLQKGLAALDKAVTLDRFNPRAWRAYGNALYAARRYADALERQREAVRLSPKLSTGHAAIGDTLLMQGNLAGAKAEYEAETTAWAKYTGLAIVEYRLGNKAAASAALAALIASDGDTAIYQQAQVRAQWGDRAGALQALDRAFTVRDPGILYLRDDPMLDPLRNDPHFKALLKRMAT